MSPFDGKLGQNLVGEPQRLVRRVRLLVEESHLVAGAGEADRPGATDESQSDEGDLAHLRSPRRGEAHSMRLEFGRRVNAGRPRPTLRESRIAIAI